MRACVCVCVCVCVCERERERETDRQTDRQTDRRFYQLKAVNSLRFYDQFIKVLALSRVH